MLTLSSFSVFACIPNIPAIENSVIIKAITVVSKNTAIEGLSGVKFLSGLKMAYVARPSNGINCPDQYSATVGVGVKEKCFSVDVVHSKYVASQNNDAEAVQVKCE